MADSNYEIKDNPTYETEIRALQDSDRAQASTVFNPLLEKMINNTHAVKKEVEGVSEKVKYTEYSSLADIGLTASGVSSISEIANAMTNYSILRLNVPSSSDMLTLMPTTAGGWILEITRLNSSTYMSVEAKRISSSNAINARYFKIVQTTYEGPWRQYYDNELTYAKSEIDNKIKYKAYSSLADIGLTEDDIVTSGTLSTIVEAMESRSILTYRPSGSLGTTLPDETSGLINITKWNTTYAYIEFRRNNSNANLCNVWWCEYHSDGNIGYTDKISEWRKVITDREIKYREYTSLSQLGLTSTEIETSETLAIIVEAMPNYSICRFQVGTSVNWRNLLPLDLSLNSQAAFLEIVRGNSDSYVQIICTSVLSESNTSINNEKWFCHYRNSTNAGFVKKISPWKKIITDNEINEKIPFTTYTSITSLGLVETNITSLDVLSNAMVSNSILILSLSSSNTPTIVRLLPFQDSWSMYIIKYSSNRVLVEIWLNTMVSSERQINDRWYTNIYKDRTPSVQPWRQYFTQNQAYTKKEVDELIKIDSVDNAKTAEVLKTSRTIGITGAVTGTPTSFNGSSNINIPITALDVGKATAGTLPVGRGGTGATSVAGALTSLGAAPANHSHTEYATTESLSNAEVKVAETLKTARTIGITGALTGTPTSFNGSSNINIPITSLDVGAATAGILSVARGGTGATSTAEALTSLGAAPTKHSHGEYAMKEDLNSVEAVANSNKEDIQELKKSVADGKSKVAKAISDKGQATDSNAAFDKMAENIGKIKTGIETGDATAISGDILSGKTAYAKGIKITGTISNKGAATITPSTSNQTIAAGQYLSGVQTIKGDANLKAANIVKGTSIFNVNGSANRVAFNKYASYNSLGGIVGNITVKIPTTSWSSLSTSADQRNALNKMTWVTVRTVNVKNIFGLTDLEMLRFAGSAEVKAGDGTIGSVYNTWVWYLEGGFEMNYNGSSFSSQTDYEMYSISRNASTNNLFTNSHEIITTASIIGSKTSSATYNYITTNLNGNPTDITGKFYKCMALIPNKDGNLDIKIAGMKDSGSYTSVTLKNAWAAFQKNTIYSAIY